MSPCIYCGQEGASTNEHLVSDWINRELRDSNLNHDIVHRNRSHREADAVIVVDQSVRTRNGPVGALVLRGVCGPCNSTWMSAVVNAARPSLSRLMRGDVDLHAYAHVAEWAVLTAMNFSAFFADGVVTESERRQFCETRILAQGWSVYIGNCTGLEPRAFSYRHTGIHADPLRLDLNTLVYTQCLGQAVVHVVKTPEEGHFYIDCLQYGPSVGLWPVHPCSAPSSLFLNGHGPPLLTAAQVGRLGSAMMDRICLEIRGYNRNGQFDDWALPRDYSVWLPILRLNPNFEAPLQIPDGVEERC